MKDLNNFIDEFVKYKESEGRDITKTISRYLTYIKEAFEYLSINTLDDLNNIKYPTIKMYWINKKIEEGLSNASMNLRITSIQFEYEKETGEYLEFELFDTKLKVLTMGSDGNNYSCDMDIDIEEINKVIDEFYG